MEVLSQLAPAAPVRSLRQGLRADALREARTCYDHIAGRLGVDMMASLLRAGHLRDASDAHDHLRTTWNAPATGTTSTTG